MDERKKLIEFTKEEEKKFTSVEKFKSNYYCNRCNNRNQNRFYQDERGVYCEVCLMFGKSSTYTLIQRQYQHFNKNLPYSLNKIVYLSELQQIASKRCIAAYENKRNVLIFAVCGAGKTEIVYDVILKAVNEGRTVCFATPRKDVVLELIPRFKRDFQNVEIVGLYGGTSEKGKIGNLYITTTHQLINYYHYFDLVILDEVDAFPYYNNKQLESFVVKAKKEVAPIIYLTATPTRKLKRLMAEKKLDYFIIPARFHRRPIPLPKVVIVNKLRHKLFSGVVPHKIMNWLKEKDASNKQVFIFVPDIAMGVVLEKLLVSFQCQFVHSQSSNRKAIIQSFRKGDLRFIITTTILERGVTVSNVDVCIIESNQSIFDERSIVQIVGRAGRDKNYPNADVRLFSEDYTRAIKDSIKHIKKMNQRNAKLKVNK
jgi:competence protein ComFA